MKTLKEIDFFFNLEYEVKEITDIKISYRGSITLKFASRKKDVTYAISANGSNIFPELYCSLDLTKEQYDRLTDILSNQIFLTKLTHYIYDNHFPKLISGIITITSENINFDISETENAKNQNCELVTNQKM